MEPIMELRKVSKTYLMGEVEVKALIDADMEIYPGELLVVLGPSGSGKSTMLNIIGGMDTASKGQVIFKGKDLGLLSPAELTQYRRERIGFVFQHYNLMPDLTALENVEMSTEIATRPFDPLEILKQVGLVGREEHFPSQLSGGEQQRVAIARAIAKNPDVLLCDEPTGALDFETGIKVLRLLKEINQQQGKIVIIITHNAAIADMAQRVIKMRSGKIDQIIHNPNPLEPEELDW